MDNLQIAKEWFDVAEMDISSAKYLQTMHPIPIEIMPKKVIGDCDGC